MTAANGPGQADKAAADKATAKVANDNAQTERQQKADAKPEAATDASGAALRTAGDATPERPDGPERLEGVDASIAPYPLYEEEDVDELASLAKSRGVEINRDVEKALLIKALRDADRDVADGVGVGPTRDDVSKAKNPYPSYDMMPLEELRDLASARDVELDKAERKGHLVGELRAADSGVQNTGQGTTA